MLLVAFMQAANCSNYTGSWRHPEAVPDYLDLGFTRTSPLRLNQPSSTWFSLMTGWPCLAVSATPLRMRWPME